MGLIHKLFAISTLWIVSIVISSCGNTAQQSSTPPQNQPQLTSTPTTRINTPVADLSDEPTASVPVADATSTVRRPTTVPPSPTEEPLAAEVPVSSPITAASPATVPVNAPVNLSTLEDPAQEIVKTATFGGAGRSVTTCPSFSEDWLTIAKYIEPHGHFYPEFGIGQISAICIQIQKTLSDDAEITVRVRKPDGVVDEISYLYSTWLLSTYANHTGSFSKIVHDLANAQSPNYHIWIYHHRVGDPVGEYAITLIIDDQEIASEEFEVNYCNCPSVSLREAPYTDIYPVKIGTTLQLDFAGFEPLEEVPVQLYRKTDRFSGNILYQWMIQMNQHGTAIVPLIIDSSVERGVYSLTHIRARTSISQEDVSSDVSSLAIFRDCRDVLAYDTETAFCSEFMLDVETGVKITDVVTGSPAERSGLTEGQIIFSMENQYITDIDQVRQIVQANLDETIQINLLDSPGATGYYIFHSDEIVQVRPENGVIGVDLCELGDCSSE
jgi:hypothetical protein